MKAIFLDRDGVINVDKQYICKIEDFTFIPGVFEAVKKARDSGYKIFVVTNQSGIALKYYSESDYKILTEWMIKQFKEKGIVFDGIYYCPHHSNGTDKEYTKECECRKPKAGMILQAAKEYNIDLSKSFVIGDKTSDIKSGQSAGCKTILVKTGYGGRDKKCDVKPDYVADDLLSAVNLIVDQS